MRKEMKLSASVLTYWFILFGLMFMLPGYPILCGAFFVTLGIYQGFQYAREANDIEFSMILPICKRDVVKGKYLFVCLIEGCGWILMLVCAFIRMTVLKDSTVYTSNALMNANLFALGGAFLLFGLFNVIFLDGFFRTAYKTGKPFILFIIVNFLLIIVLEALHHIPGLAVLNAFGFDHIGMQLVFLCVGFTAFLLMTVLSYRKACSDFDKIDL